ncbi:MAG: CRISPR-associated helicase Cas3' [Candidatus ainarchaeum sp.]|nr:CRISPR-associated helicase Cas3' [Candidatus ainarchaeum sp.]
MELLEIYKTRVNSLYFNELKNFVSGHRIDKNYESLYNHSDLTVNFFIKFVNERDLLPIFEKMLLNFPSVDKSIFFQDILTIIFLHDIGKVNPYAQMYFNGKSKKSVKSTHAEYSEIVLITLFWEKLSCLTNYSKDTVSDNERYAAFLLCFIYSARLHHSSLSKIKSFRDIENNIKTINYKEIVKQIYSILKLNFDLNNLNKLMLKSNCFSEIFFQNLFFQIKFFYSCLVLSDYYSTFCFQSSKNINEIKINKINNELFKIMEENFYKINYNKKNRGFVNNISKLNTINELRNNLLIQASNKLLNSKNKKIFMLNVPTGGGKTNISLKLALDILKFDQSINRLNYVFPFVNIIEQNFSVINKTFFDNDKIYSNLISKIAYDSIDLNRLDDYSEEKYDNNLFELMEITLNMDFINNPINILSSVNFFNMLFKTKKQNKYKFANFANSIVVIDEIQTIKAEYLDTFYTILDTIANQYNIYFIIMSATLPDINDYLNKNISLNLIDNYSDYFNHKVFRRNEIIFETNQLDENNILNYFNTKINIDFKLKNKFLIVFNTIKNSILLFESLKSNIDFKDFNIFLLNSFVDKESKLNIIKYIKDNDKKIILVSTQSIEAGVDLDFDVGFRDDTIIDSIEQVSGRINRECKKNGSKLIIFNYKNTSKLIYGKDQRYDLLNSIDEKKEILNKKDFTNYYKLYFEKIKKDQIGAISYCYPTEIINLNYDKLNELNLIEKTYSITFIKNSLLFNNHEIDEFIKNNKFKDMLSIFDFLEGKHGLEFKPLKKTMNKIIALNSSKIQIFSDDEKNEITRFLENNDYILKKVNDINFILKDNFFSEIESKYLVENNVFKYLNVFKFKELLKSENESWVI